MTAVARSFDLQRSRTTKIKTRHASPENIVFHDPFCYPSNPSFWVISLSLSSSWPENMLCRNSKYLIWKPYFFSETTVTTADFTCLPIKLKQVDHFDKNVKIVLNLHMTHLRKIAAYDSLILYFKYCSGTMLWNCFNVENTKCIFNVMKLF